MATPARLSGTRHQVLGWAGVITSVSWKRIALLVLALLAIGLRLQPILFEPSAVWPDEIFQTMEPAHRLVYGAGLVPWEFQLGARSWLLPGLIAGLMELSRLAGDGPDYYLPLIAVVFGALAAAPVLCCYLWCRSLLGASSALLGATAVALAPELVYFGARTLSEVVAGHFLVVALYILEPGHRVISRRFFLGGALLGLIFVLRIQLAPAIVITALWTGWRSDRARVTMMLAGATTVLIAAAVLDAATLGYPLAALWRYVLYNLYYGISATFGVEPWNYYLLGEFGLWGGALASLLLLAALGAWRMPLLLLTALVIVGAHSGIAHKEYRFIYPAVLLTAILAGIGLAQIAEWAREWLMNRSKSKTISAFAAYSCALGWWCLMSYQAWTGATLVSYRGHMHDNLAAASFVAHGPAPCGIGLYGGDGADWLVYGGYTFFHRPAPMYWPKDEATLLATAAGFDTLLYTQPPPAALGFTRLRCFGEVCVAHRQGICQAEPVTPLPIPALIQAANATHALLAASGQINKRHD